MPAAPTWWPPTAGPKGDRVGVVVVSYNTVALTSMLVWSLHRVLDAPPERIVVVDNGSRDGSAELLAGLADDGLCVALLNDANEHHGPGLNQGLSWLAGSPAPPDWVWLLDSDVVVATDDALAAALSAGRRGSGALIGERTWDRWRGVHRLELFSLLLDPARVWVEGIGPFEDSGDPVWPVLEAADRAGIGTVPFGFAQYGHVIHRGRATLAAVAANGESDNPLYGWAVDHTEPHFGGVHGARERYAQLRRAFRREVPVITARALASACRSEAAKVRP